MARIDDADRAKFEAPALLRCPGCTRFARTLSRRSLISAGLRTCSCAARSSLDWEKTSRRAIPDA